MRKYIVAVYSDSIEEKQTEVIVDEISIDSIKRVIQTWEFFGSEEILVEQAINSNTSTDREHFISSLLQNVFSREITRNYQLLRKMGHQTFNVYEFKDVSQVKYSVSIRSIEEI
jgi:hypothetical protein